MPAQPVSIGKDTPDPPNVRERRYSEAWHAAYRQLDEHHQSRTPAWEALRTLHHAMVEYIAFWERRTRAVERTLRVVLASDHVNDKQRNQILRVLYGAAGAGRDPKTLSEAERALIERYRTMDAAGKQMVRTLFDRLAATPQISKQGGTE